MKLPKRKAETTSTASIPPFYRRAMSRARFLERDEEVALIRKAQKGDRAAAEVVIASQLRFVVSYSIGLRLGTIRVEDVIQEANQGLVVALHKFDTRRNIRFATYATWWMRAYVQKLLKEGRSVVKPRAETVAINDASLDAPAFAEDGAEGESTLAKSLPDDAPGPDRISVQRLDDARVRAVLARLRGSLGPIGYDVVHGRLMRPTVDQETLQEIGDRHGVSRERVRQIEIKVRERLRRHLTAAGLAEDEDEDEDEDDGDVAMAANGG